MCSFPASRMYLVRFRQGSFNFADRWLSTRRSSFASAKLMEFDLLIIEVLVAPFSDFAEDALLSCFQYGGSRWISFFGRWRLFHDSQLELCHRRLDQVEMVCLGRCDLLLWASVIDWAESSCLDSCSIGFVCFGFVLIWLAFSSFMRASSQMWGLPYCSWACLAMSLGSPTSTDSPAKRQLFFQ